jgi:hypothetical protein
MKVFVVVSFKRGSSGSLYVEARKVFKEQAPALEMAHKMNEEGTSGAWTFVSATELVE